MKSTLLRVLLLAGLGVGARPSAGQSPALRPDQALMAMMVERVSGKTLAARRR